MTFPFTLFRHGPIYLEADLKCAETYVVFSRDTTAQERAWIQAECPEPVAGMFSWGERFAYFGSGGDTFDFDVVSTFGGPTVQKLLDAKDYSGVMELTPAAMEAFAAAYDAWLERVHAKVPIAFADAAGPTEPDEWGEWSAARGDDAIAALRAVRAAHPWLAKPNGLAAPKGEDHLAARARAAECFRWIERSVTELVAETPTDNASTRIEATVEQLTAFDVDVPIHRLSICEHNLHTLGQALGAALDHAGKRERAKLVAALPPRARLVYFASYTAERSGDLLAVGRDVAKALDALAAKLPAHDQWRAAALLAFIAANLAHLTPAYDKPAKQHAKVALALFRFAIARGARNAETFYDAMQCAKLASDKRAFVAIATEAIDATRDPEVAKQAARLAKAMRDPKAAKRFGARQKAIAASSKVAQSGKDAAVLAKQLASGEPTTDLVGNLALAYIRTASPDRKAIAAHVARLAELVQEPAFGLNPGVVLNFCVLAGNHGLGDRAIDVVDQLLARGLRLDEQLGLSLTYAASVSKKATAKRRVLARLDSLLDPGCTSPLTFSNLAEIHLALGDRDAAISAIAQARDLDHPTFAELYDEKKLAALRGDAKFEALFAPRA